MLHLEQLGGSCQTGIMHCPVGKLSVVDRFSSLRNKLKMFGLEYNILKLQVCFQDPLYITIPVIKLYYM
jgi:hypothetical protein